MAQVPIYAYLKCPAALGVVSEQPVSVLPYPVPGNLLELYICSHSSQATSIEVQPWAYFTQIDGS